MEFPLRSILCVVLLTLCQAAPAGPAPAPAPGEPAAPAAPGPPASADEIRKLVADGEHAEALKQLSRVLPLRGDAAAGYNKYELFMLKGDVHLKMKAPSAAVTAFTQAAEQTEDPTEKAIARASALLLRKAKALAYTPKPPKRGGKADPIDVVDPERRKEALAALFADEWADAAAKVEAAKKGKTLPPIADALKALNGLDVLERAATGADEQVKGAATDLADRGHELMDKALDKMAKRVDRITNAANETLTRRVRVPTGGGQFADRTIVRKRGLKHEDHKELKSVLETCPQIAKSAEELAVASGGEKEDVEELVEKAQDIREVAEKTLNTDYSEF
jgi:hypothetical protein